jgi:hypothetical protein
VRHGEARQLAADVAGADESDGFHFLPLLEW